MRFKTKRLEARIRRRLTKTIRVRDNMLYLSLTDTQRLLRYYSEVSSINHRLFLITRDKTYLFEAIYWGKQTRELRLDEAYWRIHWTTGASEYSRTCDRPTVRGD